MPDYSVERDGAFEKARFKLLAGVFYCASPVPSKQDSYGKVLK